MWTIELLVMAAMVVINSVFAGYEIALASVGLARLDTLAHEGKHGAASALRMKQRMEASLAVVQLGITLVGAIAAATGGAGAEAMIEPWLLELGLPRGAAQVLAIAMVVVPLTIVTIVFGELVPKVFALRNKEWVCLQLSPPMEFFSLIVWPAVWLLENSVSLIMRWGERRWKPLDTGDDHSAPTLQELRAIAALARTSRLIGRREEGIILNAARLATTPVRKIMLPAESISLLTAGSTLMDALIAAHHDMHTRFPVSEQPGDPQTIIGYVNFKDIVSATRIAPQEPALRNLVRSLTDFPATLTVAECLEQMIRGHHHIALVRDAGPIVGMLTLEDILEELVGEIHDEYDRVPAHISAAGKGWVVGGNATLGAIRAATGIDLSDDRNNDPIHLTQWVTERLDRPPQGGDEVHLNHAWLLVRKIRRQSVFEAQLTPVPTGSSIRG